MLAWVDCPVVERIPGKVSGAWLFKGGATLEEFLEWFPGVGRDQVDRVMEYTRRSLEMAS